MDNTIIIKLIQNQKVTTKDLENALFNICDDVHSSCDSNCPVYSLNNDQAPDTAKDFEINRGCDCFKNGKAMLMFIKKQLRKK